MKKIKEQELDVYRDNYHPFYFLSSDDLRKLIDTTKTLECMNAFLKTGNLLSFPKCKFLDDGQGSIDRVGFYDTPYELKLENPVELSMLANEDHSNFLKLLEEEAVNSLKSLMKTAIETVNTDGSDFSKANFKCMPN